jgi:6-phosphogluconolactonase
MIDHRLFANSEELAEAVARVVAHRAGEAVRQKGRFSLALSGGTTPLTAYHFLGRIPWAERIDWAGVHLFWGDERCVALDHDFSNAGSALEALGNPPGLIPGNIHPIPGELGPGAGAEAYQKELESFFGPGGFPSFDLILLGLGPDGHVASLFPGDPALEERKKWVVGVDPPRDMGPEVARISLTLPVLNAAREVLLLIGGRGKAGVVKTLLEGSPEERAGLPAALIDPTGELTALIERSAFPPPERPRPGPGRPLDW